MASSSTRLNVEPDDVGVPSFVDRSRGWEPPSVDKSAAISQENRTNLVGMAGDLLKVVEAGARNTINTVIEGVVSDRVDQLDADADIGVDDTTLLFGSNGKGTALPEDVLRADKNLSRLKKAYDAGRISENGYWAQLNVTAKQLRSRFPGFRDEIDKTFQKYSGGVPANEIRRNMMNELSRASNNIDAATRRRNDFYERMVTNGFSHPNWQNMTEAELLDYSAPLFTEKAKVEQNKARLAEAKANREDAKELNLQAAKDEANLSAKVFWAAFSSTKGPDGKTAREALDALASQGADASPEDVAAFNAQFTMIRSRVLSELDEKLTTQYSLGQDDLKEARGGLIAMFDSISASVNDKEYGNIGQLQTRYNASKTRDDIKFLNDTDGIRDMAAANRVLGPEGADMVRAAYEKAGNSVDAVLIEQYMNKSMLGKGNGLASDYNEIKQKHGDKKANEVTKSNLNTHMALMSNPRISPEAKIATAKYLFGPGNDGWLKELNSENQAIIFPQMMALNDEMVKLKKIDPTTYENYVSWAKQEFLSMSQINLRTLNNTNVDSNSVVIQYNPATYQFDAQANPNATDLNANATTFASGINVLNGFRSLYEQNFVTKPGLDAVNVVNNSIKAMIPLLQEQGIDPNQYLLTIFKVNGFNTQAVKNEWRTSGRLLLGMGDALLTGIGNAADTVAPNLSGRTKDVIKRSEMKGTIEGGAGNDTLELDAAYNVLKSTVDEYNKIRQNVKPDDPASIDAFDKAIVDYTKAQDEYTLLLQQYRLRFSPLLENVPFRQ